MVKPNDYPDDSQLACVHDVIKGVAGDFFFPPTSESSF